MKAISMRAGRVPESAAAKNRFTDLFARITQEDDGYVCSDQAAQRCCSAIGPRGLGRGNRRFH